MDDENTSSHLQIGKIDPLYCIIYIPVDVEPEKGGAEQSW